MDTHTCLMDGSSIRSVGEGLVCDLEGSVVASLSSHIISPGDGKTERGLYASILGEFVLERLAWVWEGERDGICSIPKPGPFHLNAYDEELRFLDSGNYWLARFKKVHAAATSWIDITKTGWNLSRKKKTELYSRRIETLVYSAKTKIKWKHIGLHTFPRSTSHTQIWS